jgi:putative DNA primase/helicase
MGIETAIADAGLGMPHVLHDGKIHRFTGAEDKPGSNSCWYVSFGTAGAFGSWKLGLSETWHDGSARSKDDDAALAKQIRLEQKRRKAEIARKQKRAQEKARYLWSEGSKTIFHPYLEAKQIISYGIRQKGDRLLIPMYYQGDLWNIQQIQPDGTKRFLKGGRVSGCYMPIGWLSGHIYICEGYATGCSLHEHTGRPAAVAFNAGNLKQVALVIRKKHPGIKITIAADNDINTKGNPGLTKGRAVAASVGGYVIYPDFSDEDFEGTDYNDYLTQGGRL